MKLVGGRGVWELQEVRRERNVRVRCVWELKEDWSEVCGVRCLWEVSTSRGNVGMKKNEECLRMMRK